MVTEEGMKQKVKLRGCGGGPATELTIYQTIIMSVKSPATSTVSLEVLVVFSGRKLSLHDIGVPL